MREDLIQELKRQAGLNEEQARRSVEVFERFLAERAPAGREVTPGSDQFWGLFTGSRQLFEDPDKGET